MSDPFSWIDAEAAERSRAGLARVLKAYGPSSPGRLDGGLINFASNDYLGLASDPRVVEAAAEAARRYGWGAGASSLVVGWREPHQRLAEELAAFEGTEAAVVFPTGFAANMGTIAALVGREDAVYSDRLNHACLIDGARLSRAQVRVYPHNDADQLESILRRDAGRFRRSLIVTDGVFSMDGDLAPLAELTALAERFDCMLMVDEAHGTGVFGLDGRGAASECGVARRVPIKVGTLSKALGSVGGFVAGSSKLIDHLINRARPLIYSTALPPACAEAARAALRIVQEEAWRRERVRMLGNTLRQSLREAGQQVPSSTGPIVPLIVGEPERAVALSTRLREVGYIVPAIRPPTVPAGTSRLRISLTADHREENLAGLVAAFGF